MRKIRVVLPLFIALASAGCGGSSTSNPYAGTWIGPWSDPGTAQQGTLTLQVATNGNIGGMLSDVPLGVDGTVSGSVDDKGKINTTYTYPGRPTTTAQGTITIGGNGHLTGATKEFQNGNFVGNATFDLTVPMVGG